MNYLFVGDVHNRSYMFDDVKRLDKKFKFDKIIFMGDYVDDWYTDNHDSLKTLNSVFKLKEKEPNKYTFLLGNHELSYLGYPCSGHKFELDYVVEEQLKSHIDYFDLYTIAICNNEEYLCTHAGLSNAYIRNVLDEDNWRESLYLMNHDKLKKLDLLNICSRARGGLHQFGSFMWADKREHEKFNEYDYPIVPNQIIGHTLVKQIEYLKPNFIFIDTHSANMDGSVHGDKSYLSYLDNKFCVIY